MLLCPQGQTVRNHAHVVRARTVTGNKFEEGAPREFMR